MKQSKRITAGVLLVLLAASVCVSCGDTTEPQTKDTSTAAVAESAAAETEAVTEDPALRDSLPDTDLNGYQYRMAVFGTDIQRIMTYNDEEDGNIVNDAVYHKIRTVEERFNTDIVLAEISKEEDDQVGVLKSAIMAGDDSCEIAQGHDVNLGNASLEGLFVNVYDIPYLDFSKPWWLPETLESMTVAGQMYMMFNNISYSNLAQMRVMYFNKKMMQALDFAYPYQMVYDGTWTLDAMKQMTAAAYSDLNGDGTRDEGDRYGYVNMPNYYGMLEPFHVEPYRKDNNGTLYYEVDLERTTEVVEKFYDLIFGEGGYLMPRKYEDYSARVLNMVSEGRSMFFYGSLDHAVHTFSDTDFVFGVLPMPKLDAAEDGYYGGSFDRPFVVPTTAQNLENIGIVTEALNAEGYKQVYPAFYEIAMKTRYADQTDDAKMIDIVHDNVIISFTYLFGDYKSIFNMMWDLFNNTPSTDVASWCAKKEKAQEKRVEKLMKFFEDNRS